MSSLSLSVTILSIIPNFFASSGFINLSLSRAPLIISTLSSLPKIGKDPFYSLPDPKLQGCASIDLLFNDPGFVSYSSEKKVKNLLKLEEEALVFDKRLSTEEAYYSDSKSYIVHADSNGFIKGCTIIKVSTLDESGLMDGIVVQGFTMNSNQIVI